MTQCVQKDFLMVCYFEIIKLENNSLTRNNFISCFDNIDITILKLRVDEYFSYSEIFHYGIIFDGEIVGFLFSTKSNLVFKDETIDGLYILDFIVSPYFRDKKIGSCLLRFYVDKYRSFKIMAHTCSLIFEKMLRKFDFNFSNFTRKQPATFLFSKRDNSKKTNFSN